MYAAVCRSRQALSTPRQNVVDLFRSAAPGGDVGTTARKRGHRVAPSMVFVAWQGIVAASAQAPRRRPPPRHRSPARRNPLAVSRVTALPGRRPRASARRRRRMSLTCGDALPRTRNDVGPDASTLSGVLPTTSPRTRARHRSGRGQAPASGRAPCARRPSRSNRARSRAAWGLTVVSSLSP